MLFFFIICTYNILVFKVKLLVIFSGNICSKHIVKNLTSVKNYDSKGKNFRGVFYIE